MQPAFIYIIILICNTSIYSQLYLRPTYNKKDPISDKKIAILAIQDSIYNITAENIYVKHEFQNKIYSKLPTYLSEFSQNNFFFSDVNLKEQFPSRKFTIQRPHKYDSTRVYFPKKGELVDLGINKADYLILLCGIDIYITVSKSGFMMNYVGNLNANCIVWDNVNGDFVAQGIINTGVRLRSDIVDLTSFDKLLFEASKTLFKDTRFEKKK